MLTFYRQNILNCFKLAVLALVSLQRVDAQEKSNDPTVESLLANLKTATISNVKATAAMVDAVLGRLRTELSDQAIGAILTQDLQLDTLASELRRERPDAATLRSVERSLRRILPGRVQRTVNELRTSVAALAKLVSSTPTNLDDARRAIAIVNVHFKDVHLRQTSEGDIALRTAFSTLAELHPSAADIDALRQRLSLANYSSLIKKDFLTTVSCRTFELPVHFQECKEKTAIVADGKVQVALSLELPPSLGESHLRVHATGTGQINASANRSQIHAHAGISPKIQATQSLHIRPAEITGDSPSITAHLKTRLTSLQMDGLLGRCTLIEKVASQAVQKRLTANDKSLAGQIERTARARIEDEGFELAYRVNGLIRHGLWDRIASLDFAPDVRLQNNFQGIRSDIDYARKDQLGAMSSPPDIPSKTYPTLDLITWVHESVANNALDSLNGMRLDEATIRGVWRVELKLTHDDWEKMQPAKIPAVITLADRSPVTLRFLSQSIELQLRAIACEVDGHVEDVQAREMRIQYRLHDDARGLQFARQEIEFPESLPAVEEAIWLKALDRFFPKTVRPFPKFRNTGFPEFLRIGYLNVSRGWIVAGVSRVSPSSGPSPQMPKETSR